MATHRCTGGGLVWWPGSFYHERRGLSTVPCCAMLCRAWPRKAPRCKASPVPVPCHAMPRSAMLCKARPCAVNPMPVPCFAMLRSAGLCAAGRRTAWQRAVNPIPVPCHASLGWAMRGKALQRLAMRRQSCDFHSDTRNLPKCPRFSGRKSPMPMRRPALSSTSRNWAGVTRTGS